MFFSPCQSGSAPLAEMAAVQETAPAADADSPGDCLALLAPSTTGGGRAVVAARDLEPGTTVLASLPAAAVVHDHLRPLRCARCLSRQPTVKNLNRCVQCKQVWYCSKGCQVADWKAGHKAECRHMASLGSGPALTDGASPDSPVDPRAAAAHTPFPNASHSFAAHAVLQAAQAAL